MAQIDLALKADTSALREVMAELTDQEAATILAMTAAGDDSWVHIGDPQQVDAGALVFTIGISRDAIAAFKPKEQP